MNTANLQENPFLILDKLNHLVKCLVKDKVGRTFLTMGVRRINFVIYDILEKMKLQKWPLAIQNNLS